MLPRGPNVTPTIHPGTLFWEAFCQEPGQSDLTCFILASRSPQSQTFSPDGAILICFRARNALQPVPKSYHFVKSRETHGLCLELGPGAATLRFYARKASECICQIQSCWEESRLMFEKSAFSGPPAKHMHVPPGISDPLLFLTITVGDGIKVTACK